MPRGKAIPYNAAELAWLEKNYTLPRVDLERGFQETFARDVSAKNLRALGKRRGWRTGRTGRFAKGQEPANKGLRRPGWSPGRMKETQFKKGERRGVALELWKPIGTERLSKDGYLERKINNDMPLRARWRAVHLIRWEEINGPVPEGYALKCIDSNRLNTSPDNWKAVPRSMLPKLAGRWAAIAYDDAPPELKPSLMAIAELEQAARNSRNGRTRPICNGRDVR